MPGGFDYQSQYSDYYEICTSGKISDLVEFEKRGDDEKQKLIGKLIK